ncbi:alpha/beta hydrolase [Actinocorallia populi]|uniref:alpha/beta hydrolase n=1 Tax=Actinocorallia populi TaxID=2079200 RepID=UPI001300A5B9|nr:alpha/beta hydrolase [Actinocorallia populi]
MNRLLPALALLVLLGTAACQSRPAPALPEPSPTVDEAALERFYQQKPRWRACEEHRDLRCADVEVPLDYLDPEARTLQIAVARLKASGSRLGSLLVNPGGPGVSGVKAAHSARGSFTPGVRERYDIVGFDPRGVGRSNGIRCLDDDQLDRYHATDSTPDTRAERRRLRTMSRRYAEECQDKAGWILPHMGTENVARDLDVLRAVLGDDRLNYYGTSYGTQLGQVYAGLFPGRVRRMVLDSVIDSAYWAGEVQERQLRALDEEFDLFLDSCVRHGCALGRTRQEARAAVWRLLGRTDERPLRSPDGRKVSDTDVHTASVLLAMEPRLWSQGRRAFAEAARGEGRTFRRLADAARGRSPRGIYDSSIPAWMAVTCLETPEDIRRKRSTDRQIARMAGSSPVFADVNTTIACSYWKPISIPQKAIESRDIAPILLLNNTRDPRTPLKWAEAVTKRFTGAFLLVNEAVGHGVYGRGSCVNRAVDDYLTGGTLPSAAHCSDSGPDY